MIYNNGDIYRLRIFREIPFELIEEPNEFSSATECRNIQPFPSFVQSKKRVFSRINLQATKQFSTFNFKWTLLQRAFDLKRSCRDMSCWRLKSCHWSLLLSVFLIRKIVSKLLGEPLGEMKIVNLEGNLVYMIYFVTFNFHRDIRLILGFETCAPTDFIPVNK